MIKLFKYIGIISILALLVVTADYFAMFGVKPKKILDFSVLHFKTIDEDSGAPIFSAHVTCYRHGNHDICQERQGKKKDIVSAYFPYHKTQYNTFFFTKSEKLPTAADPDFKIMIIHNDYHNIFQDFDMNNIYANAEQEITIKMKSRDWGDSDGIENE